MKTSRYVVWVEGAGSGSKPIPCSEINPSPVLGEEYLELVGVEQIKEAARPTMTVTSVTVLRSTVTYMVGGYEEEAPEAKEPTLELVTENKRELFETNSTLKDELINQSAQAGLDYDMKAREEKQKAVAEYRERAQSLSRGVKQREEEVKRMRDEIAELEAQQKKSTAD